MIFYCTTSPITSKWEILSIRQPVTQEEYIWMWGYDMASSYLEYFIANSWDTERTDPTEDGWSPRKMV